MKIRPSSSLIKLIEKDGLSVDFLILDSKLDRLTQTIASNAEKPQDSRPKVVPLLHGKEPVRNHVFCMHMEP